MIDPAPASDYDDLTMARLLSQRYGDGLIYFTTPGDRVVYELAILHGFVTRQGYITAEGRHYWAARS